LLGPWPHQELINLLAQPTAARAYLTRHAIQRVRPQGYNPLCFCFAERLSAFERFLQRQVEWRGKVTYLQIAPRSRTEIPEYADIERETGAVAGRINGAYGEADWTPIRYVNRAYSHATLAGLYRTARVALVAPLRDGMNLVAKEYLASQNPDDPGVLILSRFAGAAQECKAALMVNPYDPDSVAAALGQALSMPLTERRERYASLFDTLSRNDIRHWAHSFLTTLEREPSTFGRFRMESVH
jgi:trehalose 6-phosphate synthase